MKSEINMNHFSSFIFFLYASCFIAFGCDKNGELIMLDENDMIRKETKAFTEAWNRGDARAAAAFFTENGLRVGAFGDVQNGRDEIEAAYTRLLHETMPGATVNQDEGSIRILSSDLAIVQGGIEIIPPGDASPLRGYIVEIRKKVGGRWLILEAHPKLYPPVPNID
jgi:uncharacterized protein (TIGR02246 family)